MTTFIDPGAQSFLSWFRQKTTIIGLALIIGVVVAAACGLIPWAALVPAVAAAAPLLGINETTAVAVATVGVDAATKAASEKVVGDAVVLANQLAKAPVFDGVVVHDPAIPSSKG